MGALLRIELKKIRWIWGGDGMHLKKGNKDMRKMDVDFGKSENWVSVRVGDNILGKDGIVYCRMSQIYYIPNRLL